MKKIIGLILCISLVMACTSLAFADTTYIVKSGDSLVKIGKSYGVSYTQIAQKNNIKNPNIIKVGQKLIIPSKTVIATTKPTVVTTTTVEKPAVTDYTSIKNTKLRIATTTSTNDTGLLGVLVPAFDKKYGTNTTWVSVGSGEAMEMGKRGDADVLLVHSRASEDEFIADGYGLNRQDVMYNFYYVIGPKADPARVKAAATVKDGFKAIYDGKAVFLSRADKSGTNTKELAIWKSIDLAPNGLKETWYKETGSGMGDVLTMANEMKGYTLADSGTWGSMKNKLSNLEVVYQGDPMLYNPYGVITVNPAKFTNLNSKAATAFTEYITSAEGQKIIGDYVKNGQKLFVPNAK